MRRLVVLERHADLDEVVEALRPPRGLAGRLHGREQQRDQHGDDRDHDQQLDQGEAGAAGAAFAMVMTVLPGLGSKVNGQVFGLPGPVGVAARVVRLDPDAAAPGPVLRRPRRRSSRGPRRGPPSAAAGTSQVSPR